jgi:O-6-methylguanine DNA methyltransferase
LKPHATKVIILLKFKISNLLKSQSGMNARTQTTTYELAVPTADGNFVAHYSEKGLCALDFPSSARASANSDGSPKPPAEIRRWHTATVKALSRALSGRTPGALPPLDLSAGTDFQKRVWGALREIASGRTSSYGEVAQAIGRPQAVRAVGGACGANPIPVLVPCHRVLAADRKLGGFSSGLHWKRILLAREGVALAP